ncbi:MAG: TetR/AcrR family transcriptional regulator [Leptospirales bacterium]|jgi:AcrR family transcriptional regulator
MAQAQSNFKSGKVYTRVLTRARELFYRNGYYRTGVREIIKSARAATASFYDNFGSKENLATDYLLAEETAMRENLSRLIEREPDPLKFLRLWLIAKKKDLRAGLFVGCPFAGFAYQSAEMEAEHRETLAAIMQRWESLLKDYIRAAIDRGFLRPETDPLHVTRRIILLYQGGVAAWRISGNRDYIKHMQNSIMEEIHSYQD